MADKEPLSKAAINGFLALLLGYVIPYRKPHTNEKALAQHLKVVLEEAKPVLRMLGAHRSTHERVIGLIARGNCGRTGMPTAAYGTALANVRKEISVDKTHRETLRKFLVSPEMHESQQQLAGLLMRMLTPVSDTVDTNEKNLDKKISIIPDKVLRLMMVPLRITNNQPEHLAEMKHLVKKWTGRNDHDMSAEEKVQAKEADPDRYKHYLELGRKLNDTWKDYVRTEVRKDGRPIRVDALMKQLKQHGINFHPFDTMAQAGLGDFKLDEDSKLLSPEGIPLNSAIPLPGSRIVRNPKYDPKTEENYLFMFKVPNGTGIHLTKVYTIRSRDKTKDEGSHMIHGAIKTVPAKRPRWLQDLKSSDPMKRILAAMCEIVWECVPRIGSESSPTYGLSTLKLGHVNINNGNLIFNYSGKKGIRQHHIIKPDLPEHKAVIATVARLMKSKGRNERLWTDPQGRPITASIFNQYLKNNLKLPITAHEFRDVRGTMEMQNALNNAKIPQKASQAQVEAAVKKLAIRVGELLGHKAGDKVTPMTAIKAYIVPSVISKFFQERNLRVPKWVPTGGRGE